MSRTLQIVLALVLVAAAGTLGFSLWRWHAGSTPIESTAAPEMPAGPPPGEIPEMRPVFALKDRSGELRSIKDWDGKSLVINFWATWCPPCRREIPMLKNLHAARAAQGIEVIGVAVDFRDKVLAYADQIGINYPLLIGEQEGLDAAAAFGLESMGFPFTVFTDEKGRIVTLHLGELQQAQADLILDTVVALNEGRLNLEQAKQKIAAGMKRSAAG